MYKTFVTHRVWKSFTINIYQAYNHRKKIDQIIVGSNKLKS